MARKRALVSGTVQGVGFRYFTEREAGRLGLSGWVRNRRDGRVEVLAEGPEEKVGKLLERLREGPSASRVSGVEVSDEPEGEPLGGFYVERTV